MYKQTLFRRKNMICKKCGEKFSDNLRYCPNCNTNVAEEVNEMESFGELPEDRKKKKFNSFYLWPIISISIATVMGFFAFMGGRIFSGLCSVAAIVLCVFAILIRKGKIKGKTVRFSILLIMFSFLLILNYIAVFDFDITTYKKYDWPTTGLSQKIPPAEFKYGKIFENNDKRFSITIYHVSQKDFDNYFEKCKNTEFMFEDKKFKNYYTAYSKDGYELTLNYEEKESNLRIHIVEGEPFVPDEDGESLEWMLDYIPKHFPD
jgi:hypothetical protein